MSVSDPAIVVGDAVVYHGSNLDVLPLLPDCSVDSIVTDPPYELGFMGKTWDSSGIAYNVKVWSECLRVLKPGGHLLAFGGSRTYHRLGVAIEDAGFEIRDTIAWISSKTFPKSLNVSKALEKSGRDGSAAEGWGTGLKQVVEPVVLARKPLVGTVADNFETWRTGAMNIAVSRIATKDRFGGGAKATSGFVKGYEGDGWQPGSAQGRWPANVILDQVSAELLDEQNGEKPSRFFYVAKASKGDRNEGLQNANDHPTVKPTQLMRYLIKLVTPAGGVVLDPFTGSGSTGKAALLDGYGFVGIELNSEYLPIIEGRLKYAQTAVAEVEPTLFD
jgi:DNA modification methylase